MVGLETSSWHESKPCTQTYVEMTMEDVGGRVALMLRGWNATLRTALALPFGRPNP